MLERIEGSGILVADTLKNLVAQKKNQKGNVDEI